uniref:flagellin n=1 Tax=Mobiluncus mulieris TaxID=2052 RepID=UPI0037CBFBE6
MKAGALAKDTTYTFNLEGKSFTFTTGADAPTKDSTIESLKVALKGKDIGYVAGGDTEQSTGTKTIVEKINAAGEAANGKYTLTIDGKKYEYDTTAKGAEANAIVQGLNEKLKGSGYELVGDKVEGEQAITSFKLKATTEATQNKQVEFSMESTAAGADIATEAAKFKGEIGKAHGTGFEFTVGDDASITIKRADGKKIEVAMAHSITSTVKGKTAGTTDDVHVPLKAFDIDNNEITDVDKLVFKDDALTVVDHDSAQNLINVLDRKISSVSTARANIGAIQNRFEHTITNLNVAVENLAASESRIRDTDMAQEMMQFTRNQILSQAGTSMLAQANQVPQGVLSLLR